MATGHTTYSTVHADSAKSLIRRLEGKPISIPRIMLQSLDIVCIQIISKVKNKRSRRCTKIIEIIDIDPSTKEILTNDVFNWDPIKDTFIYSGKSYVIEKIRISQSLDKKEIVDELKQRAELLEWMNANDIRDFTKVASMTANYIENKNKVLAMIRNDR
jgi:flagellar protein FlaI